MKRICKSVLIAMGAIIAISIIQVTTFAHVHKNDVLVRDKGDETIHEAECESTDISGTNRSIERDWPKNRKASPTVAPLSLFKTFVVALAMDEEMGRHCVNCAHGHSYCAGGSGCIRIHGDEPCAPPPVNTD